MARRTEEVDTAGRGGINESPGEKEKSMLTGLQLDRKKEGKIVTNNISPTPINDNQFKKMSTSRGAKNPKRRVRADRENIFKIEKSNSIQHT